MVILEKSTSNMYLNMNAQNVLERSQSNIAHRDASNKIGLKFISSSALDRCQKQEIQFF